MSEEKKMWMSKRSGRGAWLDLGRTLKASVSRGLLSSFFALEYLPCYSVKACKIHGVRGQSAMSWCMTPSGKHEIFAVQLLIVT